MRTLLLAVFIALVCPLTARAERPSELDRLLAEFEAWSGARIVFERDELPKGDWFDIMRPLDAERRPRAVKLLVAEVKKYPRGYLKAIGFESFGVFGGLASKTTDGYRPLVEWLGGYRYFGLWNGSNAAIGAFYTDVQLPLTFHHELFHHVDGSANGKTSYRPHFNSDDAAFSEAVSGRRPYPAARIPAGVRRQLRLKREGYLLEDAVGNYASKAAGEDQAETARHFMTSLADSLLQVAERPDLPGSQRILHILKEYQGAAPNGPDLQHWLTVALKEAPVR